MCIKKIQENMEQIKNICFTHKSFNINKILYYQYFNNIYIYFYLSYGWLLHVNS